MEDIACRSPEDLNTIFTIGHSTRTLAEFMSLLEEVQVDLVVDVRSIPRSRTNPQFNLDVLPEALAAARKSALLTSARAWRPAPSC